MPERQKIATTPEILKMKSDINHEDVANDRIVDVFKRTVRKNFGFLKTTSSYNEAVVKGIPLPRGMGTLLPVCEVHASDVDLIEKLSQWRRVNAFAYPTQFPVTTEGTADWLRKKILDVEDRVLFLVLDRYGYPIGHLGYANSVNDQCEMEIDNVVRGVKTEEKGIMSAAMNAVLDWAENVIGPARIILRVMDDNGHAIRFYNRLGFKEESKISLRRHVNGDVVSFLPVEADDSAAPDKYFLRMSYVPQLEIGGKLILTAGPSISGREALYAWDAARNGWNHQWADYIKKFESTFASYLGVKYALSFSSCTGALHLGLLALGIGPGDEVIVPDITWVATANAVLYTGATPVFADVHPETWCVDPASIEKCISSRTKAIMPVHLYGHPAPMDVIMDIARRHKLFVVEDAAPSIGAELSGKKTGTFGDVAAFSFQGAKLVVSGEGGMLVTNNDEVYKKVYSLWDQGRRAGTFWIDSNGWKYKMSNVQAAIGLAQIERVDELIEMKRRVFRWYEEGLRGVPYIRLSREPEGSKSIYWMTSILLEERAPITRDGLRGELRKRNIDTRNVFPAISQYPIWPRRQNAQPIAQRVGEQGINLPSGVCLRREEVGYVCDALRKILA